MQNAWVRRFREKCFIWFTIVKVIKLKDRRMFFEEIDEFWNDDTAMIVEIVENAAKENKKAL
jgi:hypothetical protein